MKRICFLIVFLSSIGVFAQEENPKFRTFTDFGYFGSSFKPASKGGTYLSAGAGYKINQDFWLNLNIIKISSSGVDFDEHALFLNNKTTYTNTMVIPSFTKDWEIHKKLLLSGTLGGALIFEKALLPFIHYEENSIEGISFSNQVESFDIGLFAEIAFKYEVAPRLYLTAHAKSYVAMYLEPDSFMLGAGFEIRL